MITSEAVRIAHDRLSEALNEFEALSSESESVEQKVESIREMDHTTDRFDEMASLILSIKEGMAIAKEAKDNAARIQKRFVQLQELLQNAFRDEIEVGDKITTEEFVIARKKTAPSVQVEDMKVVAKKYRREPLPVPPWEEWDIDKNAAKAALKNGVNVKGLSLVEGSRIEVKRR